MTTPLRVLLVEDSEDDALLLLHELRQRGYSPTFVRVETAPTMLTALRSGTWDVVISDWAMPNFSAPAALDVLRKEGVNIPFIIVSGSIGEETAVDAMRAGAHDFVLKSKLARLTPALARELREVEIRNQADTALLQSEVRRSTRARRWRRFLAMLRPISWVRT
jgi:DNA-binding NtrC family response regulator